MQEISARWKALADKSPYEAQAAADKRRYDEASAARDAQVLAEQEAKRKAREGGGRGTKRAAAPVPSAEPTPPLPASVVTWPVVTRTLRML